MKKFILACVILFIVNMGCKKTNADGGAPCGCSPVMGPSFSLVIKNSAGQDLLNPQTTAALTQEKIELYRKDAGGKIIPLNFSIRQPFTYGNEKFTFYQLYINDLSFINDAGDNTAYLKLGNGPVRQVNVFLGQNPVLVNKVLVDKKEIESDKDNGKTYLSIFYLTE